MEARCPKCDYLYDIEDDQVTSKGLYLTCRKCDTKFTVFPKEIAPVIAEAPDDATIGTSIKCPACGKLVSRDVSKCPHCQQTINIVIPNIRILVSEGTKKQAKEISEKTVQQIGEVGAKVGAGLSKAGKKAGEELTLASQKASEEIKKPRTFGIALFIAGLCGIFFWPLIPASFILSIFMLRDEKKNPGKYGDSVKLIKTVFWGYLSIFILAIVVIVTIIVLDRTGHL